MDVADGRRWLSQRRRIGKLLNASPEPMMLRNCAVINKEDKQSFVWKTETLQDN